MNPIILVITSTFLGAFGSLMLKKGAKDLELSIKGLILNYKLVLGLFLSGLATLTFIIALQGGDLSYLYPFVSLTYIWILLLSYFYMGEHITKNKIIGVLLIVVGVGLIGL